MLIEYLKGYELIISQLGNRIAWNHDYNGKGIPMASLNKFSLVAPCGMNCAICMHYLREKNKCLGCRGSDINKPDTRVRCKIKTCEVFKNGNAKFCFECGDFTCEKLEHLDQRYQIRYNMSMIENLDDIKNYGIKIFLKNENKKWTCSECGGTICVHKGYCFSCGKK